MQARERAPLAADQTEPFRPARAGQEMSPKFAGGRPLGYVGYSCPAEPLVEGDNRIWGPCAITRVRSPGDTVTSRMTGPILERDGRFKFISLTSDDD